MGPLLHAMAASRHSRATTKPLRNQRPISAACYLGPQLLSTAPAALLAVCLGSAMHAAVTAPASPVPPPAASAAAPGAGPLFIQEYRVEGSHLLKQAEIGEAVYPFLGPGRTEQDVEQARAALEKVYKDKGYQTVSVQVPNPSGRGGIIMPQVTEATVGRLRVHGSRYFSLAEIKRRVPSLAEGQVPNFNDVTREMIALGQWPDRQIKSAAKPGAEPGTVDIDLTD